MLVGAAIIFAINCFIAGGANGGMLFLAALVVVWRANYAEQFVWWWPGVFFFRVRTGVVVFSINQICSQRLVRVVHVCPCLCSQWWYSLSSNNKYREHNTLEPCIPLLWPGAQIRIPLTGFQCLQQESMVSKYSDFVTEESGQRYWRPTSQILRSIKLFFCWSCVYWCWKMESVMLDGDFNTYCWICLSDSRYLLVM